MNKRVVFLAPYPHDQAPSQRFRFEQYFDSLKESGYEIEFHSFLNTKTWEALYNQGSFFLKFFGILGSFWRRFLLMFKIRKADYVFIHREASMIGPPIFEWIISKVLRKKYIYDFDDAIWLANYSENNARFHRLKSYWKVKKIIKWAHLVSVGNEFLKNYASKYNSNVHIIPTTVDLKRVHNQKNNHESNKVNIGWTGTHTTMQYLKILIPVLKELEEEFDFTFTIISNEDPSFQLNSLKYIQWSKKTEIDDLVQFDVGLMPLEEGVWAEGKCGFKGIQYMALGIPSVSSPIGVNKSIIKDGVNGFLCANSEEWKEKISSLLKSKSLRKQIGENGFVTVQEQFSLEANKSKFLLLFQQ